jgi:glutathione S-transferase
VPALELDSGEVLTENAVILQYLGDRAAWPEVLPPMGDFRRYRVLELVNFITTELHKRFGFLFSNASDETKRFVTDQLTKKLDWIDGRLGPGPFLMGENLTLPDPYLFVITRWANAMLGDLDRWPNLRAFFERMHRRDSVRQVLRFEGLLKEEAAT